MGRILRMAKLAQLGIHLDPCGGAPRIEGVPSQRDVVLKSVVKLSADEGVSFTNDANFAIVVTMATNMSDGAVKVGDATVKPSEGKAICIVLAPGAALDVTPAKADVAVTGAVILQYTEAGEY